MDFTDAHAFLEGRCRQCGWRVVVDREDYGHTRAGRWCGPVETERPFSVPDDPVDDSPVWGRSLGSLAAGYAPRETLR